LRQREIGDARPRAPLMLTSCRLSGHPTESPFACIGAITRGRFDYSELIHDDDAGVFVALRDISFFNRVEVVDGAVTWPGELDVAPDAMYDRLKASPPNTIVKG
jgi:hypothetical protein